MASGKRQEWGPDEGLYSVLFVPLHQSITERRTTQDYRFSIANRGIS